MMDRGDKTGRKLNGARPWREIPVQDLDRAVRFYEALFAISLEREAIDGNQYAHFPAVG